MPVETIPAVTQLDLSQFRKFPFLADVVMRAIVDCENAQHEALIGHHLQHVQLRGLLHDPFRIRRVQPVGADPEQLPFSQPWNRFIEAPDLTQSLFRRGLAKLLKLPELIPFDICPASHAFIAVL